MDIPQFTRRQLLASAGAAAATAVCGPLHAQAGWPSKPIRIIVPFAAGISPDIVARMVGDPLSRALGQPVIIDNRAGASGMIGAEAAAKSAPDGYTLFMSVESLVGVVPHIYSKLPYNHFRDFTAVTQVVTVPYYLVTAPNQPYQNVKDVLAQARAKPGAMDFGTLGVGSGAHVRMAMLNGMAGTQMTHIPYKSSPMPDLMAGQLSVVFEPATTAIPLIRGGKLRALGVTSTRRQAALPEVPTVAETLPGYSADGWQGFVLPSGTSGEIAKRFNAEVVKALRTADVQTRLAEYGLQPVGNSIEEFTSVMRQEYEKWGKMARDNNIRVE